MVSRFYFPSSFLPPYLRTHKAPASTRRACNRQRASSVAAHVKENRPSNTCPHPKPVGPLPRYSYSPSSSTTPPWALPRGNLKSVAASQSGFATRAGPRLCYPRRACCMGGGILLAVGFMTFGIVIVIVEWMVRPVALGTAVFLG